MWDSLSNDSCEICQCSARSRSRNDDSFLAKENLPQEKTEELSLYGGSSPTNSPYPDRLQRHCIHGRRPLEDHDPNSRDSGYNGEARCSISSPLGASFGSGCSLEDDYLEEFSDIEPLEDGLPQSFNKLVSGPLRERTEDRLSNSRSRDGELRPLFRRALSLQTENRPSVSRVRSRLFRGNDERPFKRSEPSFETEITITKKAKFEVPQPRPELPRSISVSEESIKWAVHKSSTEPDLIGDFSKTFCLPLTSGRHQDLKSITPDTLAQLIKGEFDENIKSYKVIDCRYPYEYDGGHVNGAINLYTKEQCVDLLYNKESSIDDTMKRTNILVFHCEFSSERGPNLCRYLRKQDRLLNEDTYPSLHYPEIYLLEGGYKDFFEKYSILCVPIAYKNMLHPEHENDLKYFRQKSKTWNVDTRQRPPYKGNNLKKLAL